MHHLIISLIALVLSCIVSLPGLLVVTDQGRANADLTNRFVAHRDSSLDVLFSHPLPAANPFLEPRMESWRRQARGLPFPWLVGDYSPDGTFYYARLEGRFALLSIFVFFFPCWFVVRFLSPLVHREGPPPNNALQRTEAGRGAGLRVPTLTWPASVAELGSVRCLRAMSLPELIIFSNRQQVVTVARDILEGRSGVIEGSRLLASLSHRIGLGEFDADFLPFVGIDSETDHLPWGGSSSLGRRCTRHEGRGACGSRGFVSPARLRSLLAPCCPVRRPEASRERV